VIEPTSIQGRFRLVEPLRDDQIDAMQIQAKRQRDLERLLDVVNLAGCPDIHAFVRAYFRLDAED